MVGILKWTNRQGLSHNTSGLSWLHGKDKSHDTYEKRLRPEEDPIRATDINELRNAVEALWNHSHDYWDDNTAVTQVGSSTTTCG